MSSKERYYREKEAAKLVAFYGTFNELISLYAEIRESYPELAQVIERRHPFLLSLPERDGEKTESVQVSEQPT